MVVWKVAPEAKCAPAEVRSRRGTVLRPVRRRETISERLGGALGTTGGCGFLVATRATVGPSEPSYLAVFLELVPRRLVLPPPSELLPDLGSSSTTRTFLCAERCRTPGPGA